MSNEPRWTRRRGPGAARVIFEWAADLMNPRPTEHHQDGRKCKSHNPKVELESVASLPLSSASDLGFETMDRDPQGVPASHMAQILPPLRQKPLAVLHLSAVSSHSESVQEPHVKPVSHLRMQQVIGDVPEGMRAPAQEQALRSATVVLLDRFFADVGHLEAGGDFADTDMVAYLPQRFARKYNHLFGKEFLVALGTVASKLVQPGNWPLACVGEELGGMTKVLSGQRKPPKRPMAP